MIGPSGNVSPEVLHFLKKIASSADEIERLSGVKMTSILITQHFANVLEKEGYIPQFDFDLHEQTLVWWWLTFRGVRMVSRCLTSAR